MPVQDLYIGLGSLAYAMAKADGVLHDEEAMELETILQHEAYGPIACYAFQLKKTYNAPPEEAYQFAFRRFAANQADLKPELREHFLHILSRIAQRCKGISSKEQALLKRIRKDLTKLLPRQKSFALAEES
jgi:uncharacterized tellurite resistance protein B-like protein